MDLPLHKSCRLLASHACGILAVEKAHGVLSHPNRGVRDTNAVLPLPYDAAEEAYRDGETTWYLLNRLDAPTSGVLLLASTREVAALAKAEFAAHRVRKRYCALVRGYPLRKRDNWYDCLETSQRGGRLRTRVTRGRPNAHTVVLLRDRSGEPPARALLQLEPATGRTHQLRVQCACRQLPIIGDATYGDFAFNKAFKKRIGSNRMFLHSESTRIEFTLSGKRVVFSASSDLPQVFSIALD